MIIAAVPPFARYAYEIWIIPKKQIEGPWKFNDKEIKILLYVYKRLLKDMILF